MVEVEAYTGEEDKACHTYGGKRTERTEIMYGRAGHLYVYMIYGMYFMANIVTGKIGQGQAVLLRGIEPLGNWDTFAQNRFGKSYKELSSYQRKNLSNGPGKLCKALTIQKKENGLDFLNNKIYIEDEGYKDFIQIEDKRIGVDYAEEAKDFLYRFYIEGNPYVSYIEKKSSK